LPDKCCLRGPTLGRFPIDTGHSTHVWKIWVTVSGYTSDSLHTALALSALQATSAASDSAARAIAYLIAAQNSDGGWGIAKDAASTPATTAQVTIALAGYAAASGVPAALDKAGQYLAAHQNGDGGWGADASTVIETALVYRAVRGRSVTATVKSAALNYLLTRQLPDGSWNDQPYDTALAMLALTTRSLYLPLARR
jgi:large repetitive protein